MSMWVWVDNDRVAHAGDLPSSWRRPDGRWVTGLGPELARELGWVELDATPPAEGMIPGGVEIIDGKPSIRWMRVDVVPTVDIDARVAEMAEELRTTKAKLVALESALVAKRLIVSLDMMMEQP